MNSDSILSIRDLQVSFKTFDGDVRAVNGFNLDIGASETVGLVGESGCGKSVTAKAILGLLPKKAAMVDGQILFRNQELLQLPEKEMLRIRGNDISMIFQEPMTSLNPVMKIGDQIAEALVLHQDLSWTQARKKAIEMLDRVHIPSPEVRVGNYPHSLSGGMRQRAMIAMALSCQPSVLIADEPTTALDVTIQAQIFDLLRAIQTDMDTAVILITHDMAVIAEFAKRVVVMYAGSKVEEGLVRDIIDNPQHPYTKGLIRCVPFLKKDPGTKREILNEIPGVVPNMSQLGIGCAFAPRCDYVMEKCYSEKPPEVRLSENHVAYCWNVKEAK